MQLSDLPFVAIPRELFERGHAMLRALSAHGDEGLLLWAGACRDGEFRVDAILQPAQRAIRSESGLLVIVDGAELHRINVWLFTNGLQLVAQVHTHPTDAYHSATDDAIPIVATTGGFSLVVPGFARDVPNLSSYAVFRVDDTGHWRELSPSAVTEVIRIIDPSE